MIDELPMGDDMGDAGGGDQLPAGYDPAVMSDIVSPEAFDAAPQWQKDRFQRFARKNQELKAQLETERQERAMLAARLAAVETNVNKAAEPPKEGLAAYSDADLKAWKAKALKAQQAYLADPTNDDLKAAIAQINPEHLMAVDEELMERKARSLAEKSTATLKAEWDNSRQQESFQTRIANTYGSEYVRKGTPEYAAALAEFAEISKSFDVSNDSSGAYTLLAIERAKAKRDMNRDGRGGDGALRRLAIEGQGRREAQLGNSVAALQAKGDWKSQSKAVDLQIDSALKSMYGG